MYDEYYQNEQGVSPAFQKHLERVADIVETRLGKDRLVEVGCGKGYFLRFTLTICGITSLGFDPAYEGDDPRVRREVFSPGMFDHARGVVLRHVLEHIPQPIDFRAPFRQPTEMPGGFTSKCLASTGSASTEPA